MRIHFKLYNLRFKNFEKKFHYTKIVSVLFIYCVFVPEKIVYVYSIHTQYTTFFVSN